MRCGGYWALSLLLASGCTAAVASLTDAGGIEDADVLRPDANNPDATLDVGVDGDGVEDTGVLARTDGGSADATSCCTDFFCPTCPGGLYVVGGCGPEWCGPTLPTACPALPERCPDCASLAEADCPSAGVSFNVLGCFAQECLGPEGRRFVACVSSRTEATACP